MSQDQILTPNNDWPGRSPENPSLHIVALLLSVLAVTSAFYYFMRGWQGILDLRPVDLYITASQPEQGGWKSESLSVESGRLVNLHVKTRSGSHSFALANTDVRSSRVLGPGEYETVSFVAPEPGRYVLYCTTWCSPSHWRMRTVLEVTDPSDPEVPVTYPQYIKRYDFSVVDLLLDEPHEASTWPARAPSASEGMALWSTGTETGLDSALVEDLGWPVITPEALFSHISDGLLPGFESAQSLSEEQRWALVAYLWSRMTTKDELDVGKALYTQNCAECHGPNGEGDGMAAAFSEAIEPDFTDGQNTLGASPALYYAKIARGGMGTGMPNWGVILDEDEIWALSDYLYSLYFDYTALEE